MLPAVYPLANCSDNPHLKNCPYLLKTLENVNLVICLLEYHLTLCLHLETQKGMDEKPKP